MEFPSEKPLDDIGYFHTVTIFRPLDFVQEGFLAKDVYHLFGSSISSTLETLFCKVPSLHQTEFVATSRAVSFLPDSLLQC